MIKDIDDLSPKILALDLGINYGFTYKDSVGEDGGYARTHSLFEFYEHIKRLVEHWKPNIIVVSQTNNFGHMNATRGMFLRAGVIFLLAEQKGIPAIELNDSQARKTVLGKGMKKAEVQKLYSGIQSDQLDSMILARAWWLLSQAKLDGEID